MRVRVLYYGVLKEIVGFQQEDLELPDEASIETVLTMIQKREGARADIWNAVAIALNQEYVRSSALVHNGDEIAMLPPVSGGLYVG